jgi:RecB family exonuclease
MDGHKVALDVQVLETQGLLSQLALHAGIHQQIPSFPERLTSYHKALLEYDRNNPDNLFHNSAKIDSMSVAKTLLQWRDYLALCGWNKRITLKDCSRLNTLAEIDSCFHDEGIASLLVKLSNQIRLMESGVAKIPQAYKNLVIEIPCPFNLLPDYIKPLLASLQGIGVTIQENTSDSTAQPKAINEIHFSQQWKAEVWLSQQLPTDYDVWINTDNKRLDNWLHMSGYPVCGSEMTATNPQITQMFLLAIQLFQRPLNVNTLLQYLFLSECPLDRQLRGRLARVIVDEGGFCNEKVQKCINTYIEREFKSADDETPQKSTKEQREENYLTYLPFDLRKDDSSLPLAEESDSVDVKLLTEFLSEISNYASSKAVKITAVHPYDARIAQLRKVSEMTDALLRQIDALVEGNLSFTALSQWALSLYEDGNFILYPAQVGSRCLINLPSNMIGKAAKTIWCDFYGDVTTALSTDFLSNHEFEELGKQGVLLWNKQHENDLMHLMTALPIYNTTEELTIVTCNQQGATKLSQHPMYLQLPSKPQPIDGDALYQEMATQEVTPVDNHREEDNKEIHFDAKKHPVTWRKVESYSALEKLLQNPFDYFMNYTLQFTDTSETSINIFLTYGNVAHKVVETLFTADRDGATLTDYVNKHYEEELNRALIQKGAILLLPEHHLDRERLRYRFRSCVSKLATIIQENNLTVIQCEQKEEQDLNFEGGIILQGYIDMLLRDSEGNDVVFDLKYVSKKKKYVPVLENNRALQLAIYKAMLLNHNQPPKAVRTAYFVMPYGILFSTDTFLGENCELITPKIKAELMPQIRNGYAERVKEISEGRIETADNMPVKDIPYAQAENVYPLKDDGKKNDPKKEENKYSVYKGFTI